ncbi:MAG: Phosphoserine phosphatase (EC [uncultured Sulfurovum sp.]|uniref:Phosphoserine phosphatase (EC) n=1 Tax=uncultured Sulfurovum sp. TaxID=269237 RepID=A0A6S6U108_9BACT|nr:MAG: Phosphoserine phosphatase (EC [uncultured Sulfurovum sp.]
MSKVIVYDFDKTLTYKDTLRGYFVYSGKKDLFFLVKNIIYFFSMVLVKLKMMTNVQLKEIGIKLFLSKLEENIFKEKALNYHNKITFNKLFESLTYRKENNYFIVSASFEEYLKPIFPEVVNIVASKMTYVKSKPVGIKFNCYKENKVKALREVGVETIDILYTDSYSDLEMAKIAKKIIIVNQDTLIKCSSFNEFKQYFI